MSVKYLVSGGEGALGKTVISMLLQRGEKVRILMSELSDTRIYRNNPNIEICYGISTDKDSMREFFELEDPRSAVLFHTDEYVSLSDSTNLTMRRVNVIGAENIVDMCLKRKVGKLVYLSSAYALNPEVSGDNITIHFDRNKVEGEYAKSKADEIGSKTKKTYDTARERYTSEMSGILLLKYSTQKHSSAAYKAFNAASL